MARAFRDANLKLDRAKIHIADLDRAVSILQKTYTSTIENDSIAGIQELKHIIPNYEDVMAKLALVVGDAIHNLRAALDYAWYSTIRIHAPKIAADFSKFPIGKSKERLKRTLERIKINSECPALFELMLNEFQAYKGGGDDFLWTLNDFDISDKHIFLLGFSPHASITEITVEDEQGHVVTGSTRLMQTDPPYCFRFKKSWKIKDKGRMSFEIAFKEAGIFKGVQVLEMLRIFSILASNIVRRLEEF